MNNRSLFDYPFPKELVAQHPLPRRDESRMMVVERTAGRWEHRRFVDFPSYHKSGDLLVLNNAQADLIEMGGKQVPPLPPYIKRKKPDDFTEEDFRRYRTVYAATSGSKAAPTAGFHFTEEMLKALEQRGVEIRFLTLHVSYDTYKPIRTPNILDHPMHGEEYVIPNETAEAVIKAKEEGRRIIAVGTTTVRALESWASDNTPSIGSNQPPLPPSYVKKGVPQTPPLRVRGGGGCYEISPATTQLFISPGYQFRIVDTLLTNFHRPRSTVLVMVSTFAGRELILKAYEEAIRERYRLFSYGDCMLIL